MAEKPILFSTPMVQAIMDGSKTMTRRTTGLDFINENPDNWKFHSIEECKGTLYFIFENINPDAPLMQAKCPYGQPGDLLWVRETWGNVTSAFTDSKEIENVAFKSDNSVFNCIDGMKYLEKLGDSGIYVNKWKPSIHMPKAAARIWLRVTDIRIERLQDISNKDAISEGIEIIDKRGEYKNYLIPNSNWIGIDAAIGSFMSLWKSINGRESWDLNPFVWVVSFEVLSKTGKHNDIN